MRVSPPLGPASMTKIITSWPHLVRVRVRVRVQVRVRVRDRGRGRGRGRGRVRVQWPHSGPLNLRPSSRTERTLCLYIFSSRCTMSLPGSCLSEQHARL